MEELIKKLEQKKIKFIKREHPVWIEAQGLGGMAEKVVERWQVFVGDISIVRGEVAFGNFELFGGDMDDPERFSTVDEVISFLQK